MINSSPRLLSIILLGITSTSFAESQQQPNVQSISAAWSSACAIVADGTLRCWGKDGYNQLQVPSGIYKYLSVGFFIGCAIKHTGGIDCWGYQEAYPPVGTFTQISVNQSREACGVRMDGPIICWGNWKYTPPKGTFTEVSLGGHFGCGLKIDGTIACWKDQETTDEKRITPPSGTFKTIHAGFWSNYSCAIDMDDEVKCWGQWEGDYLHPPKEKFVSITLGRQHGCGLKADGYPVCWGSNKYGEASPPKNDGPYRALSAGLYFTCGIRTNGSAICWGDNEYEKLGSPPVLNISQLIAKVGQYYAYQIPASANPGISHFAISQGELPPGLHLEEKTGLLSGTPTKSGTYEVGVIASNDVHTPANKIIQIEVMA